MECVIIGCGYVGLRLAQQLAQEGHVVYGVRRSISDQHEFRRMGVIPLALDITQPEQLDRLPSTVQWIVNAVSSSKRGAEVYRQVYLEGASHLIERLRSCSRLEKYVHVSSTSVYGQLEGTWIDEQAPRNPGTETSQILVATENLLLGQAQAGQVPACIARASGIYGPERGFLFEQYLQGQARMIGDGSRLINMIHVDDLVSALQKILESGHPGEAYNVTDPNPVTQKDFFAWLAQELNRPLPPPASDEDLKRRKRALTNKKVSSRKLVAELGFSFRYPSYREGYRERIAAVTG
jgi:nucleoside-diphosphate-sugar epimerase